MSWRQLTESVQSLAAHILLFTTTLFLVLKLDHTVSHSWGVIFAPLWPFHAFMARARFSLPAPSIPHDRHVVFLPLLIPKIIILTDNFRMCRALLPENEADMNDKTIWETLPHFWVAISMVFLVAATTFTLLKLSGDVSSLGWWDLFLNYGIAECSAFLICTKWSNPLIHGHSQSSEASSSSMSFRSFDWTSSFLFSSEIDENHDGMCILENICGHVMKIPVVGFQVLLFMHLEGMPPGASRISIPVLFSPLFLLQGAGVLVAILRLGENIFLLLHSGTCTGSYFTFSSRAYDFFGFLYRGSRLLGWWSIDEGTREEQARLYHSGVVGCGDYNQLLVSKPKPQNIASRSLKGFKLNCAEKCKKCPICRISIKERMHVYDV